MKTKITLLTIILAFFSLSMNVIAQAGSNDNTFNALDVDYDPGQGADAIAVQSDGKIIIGGAFTSYNGVAKNRLVRLNTDGTIDASFNIGTGANNPINAIAIQSDGKIIIGGRFSSYNGTSSNGIARLNTNGSYDATFIVGTGTNSYGAVVLAIQTDGKIIFGGTFTSYNGTALSRIGRLNTDGSVDATFNSGTGLTSAGSSYVYGIAIGSDGKIAVGGDFQFYNGVSRKNIALLNSDGTLNTSFLIGTGPNNSVLAVAIQSDGKVIIGGYFTSYNGSSQGYMARLNTDGTRDPNFLGAPKDVDAITIQADGKVLFGGWNNSSDVYIGRRNTNGSADYLALTQTGVSVSAIAVQSDGKIIVGGNYYQVSGTYRNGLARLNVNGSVDKTFNRTYGVYLSSNYPTAPIVQSICAQSDGKILMGGNFISYDDTLVNYLTRANADGSVDPTFSRTGDFGLNSVINAIGVQSDGKIIAAGTFVAFNNISKNRIIRFLAGGSVDPAFTIGTGANGDINAIAIQPDGKIIIAGSFSTYNGTARSCIARLNTDGTLDAGFVVGTGANNVIKRLALQGDGKIIIVGQFTAYNGTTMYRIARLNVDGSLDATFIIGTGADSYVYAVAIQPGDGKVIIGGYFGTYNGFASSKLARINADGSYDPTFTVGTGFTGISIDAIALQSDGKIIFGGNFTKYKGVTIGSNLVRIDSVGSIDASFNVGVGVNGPIKTSTLQSDGKLIIGGSFTKYNGAGRHHIARVITSCTPPAPTSTTILSALDICTGSGTTLTATVSGTSGWYDAPGAGNYLGGGTSFTTPVLTGSTTYYVQDSSSCGASGTRTAITVVVAPIPSISGSTPASRCGTGTVMLGATANTATLNWYAASTGGTSLGTGLSFTTPSISDTTNYYVEAVNICGSSTRTTVKASVTDLPVVALSLPATKCLNSAPLVLTGGTPVGGIYSGNGVGSGNFNPIYLGTNTIIYTYSDGTCSNSNTQTIFVNALPAVTATADFSICAADTITLAGSGATSFVWNNSVTNGIPFIISVTTTYKVTGTDVATGCSNTDSTVVTVSPVDTSLSLVGFTFTANATTGAVYRWLNCNSGTIIPAQTGQSYTATTPGSYALEVTENGCTDTSACYTILSTGISKTNEYYISTYPNPTSGIVTINFHVSIAGKIIIKDILGQVLISQTIQAQQIEVDLSNYANGMFFINIETDSFNQMFTVTKK